VPGRIRPGDVIADRYVVADLLTERENGWFWRADDRMLGRYVAIHIVAAEDPRSEALLEAARGSATVHDPRILRVLDAAREGPICYVVNEWGEGTSLDIVLLRDGPLSPRKAAWVAGETASVMAVAHEQGVAHGRLAPENVLFDQHGAVRIIGLAVEAALWGLPPGRMSTDVSDIGALLYAGLTGRWAGVSRSALPAAMQSGGRVLPPRKVRAGIPRILDDLCDLALNPTTSHVRAAYDVTSARGLAEVLADFVGDPTGLAVPEEEVRPVVLADAVPVAAGTPVAGSMLPPEPVPSSPAVTGPGAEVAPEPADEPEGEAEMVPDPATAPEPDDLEDSAVLAPVDQPTQAGMPVFTDDSDDVGWISRNREERRPPPPFEDPPERPLFAPPPAEGEPVRRTRPGVVAVTPEDYWPWGDNSQSGAGGSRSHPGFTTTGQGLKIVEEDEPDDQVPGRSWLRLALGIALVIVLGLAALVAYNLSQGRSPLPFDTGPGPSPTSSRSPVKVEVVSGTTARDLDPQGSDGEENRAEAPLAVDGDRATAWSTSQYKQQLGPSGLKTGVGLVVDLGAERTLRQVSLDLVGQPTGVQLFVTGQEPTDVAGLDPAATTRADGTHVDVTVRATGRYVVVWLTSLPPDGSQWRGGVAEVTVRAVVS
jgi:hypothetical protein